MTNAQRKIEDQPMSATDGALATLADAKTAFFGAVDANAATVVVGKEAASAIKVAKRPLTWAIVDVATAMVADGTETQVTAFVKDQASEISEKLGENDASKRKTESLLQLACGDYVAKLSRFTSEDRSKIDAGNAANKLKKADEQARQKKADNKAFGERAKQLIAQHQGVDVEDVSAALEDGDTETKELKARFIAILKNGGSYVTTVTEGWAAASDATRAEVRRFMVANMNDDEKTALRAMLD